MKLLDMKWGYDGGGVCCGPVAGSTIVEIEVLDENDEKFYVHNSRCGSYPCEYIVISRESGFEIAMGQDLDRIMAYKESAANKVYEHEIGEQSQEAENSPFAPVMRLTQMAMEAGETGMKAEEWFADYKGKDTSQVRILDFISWDGYGRAYLKECMEKCGHDKRLVEKLEELCEPYLEESVMEGIEDFLLELLASDVETWNERLDEELGKNPDDEIPKCPKCGETLEIVIRGPPRDLSEKVKKGFKFFPAGCCVTGYGKTDYVCRNCSTEFDEDRKERDRRDYEYLR